MVWFSTRVLRPICQAFHVYFRKRPSHGSQPAAIAAEHPGPARSRGSTSRNRAKSATRRHASTTHAHGQVPFRLPGGEAQLLPQPLPAIGRVLGRRLIVDRRQQGHVAGLVGVELVDRQRLVAGGRVAGLLHLQDAIDQLRHGQREDGVDVVPQPPLAQGPIDPPPAAVKTLAEAVDERVEVVVLHDEDLAVGMIGVVVGQPPHDLQPHGRLAGALLAEDDARGRLGRVAVDLVPGRMEHAANAGPLEHEIGLRVLVGKGIGGQAVMFEELLYLHG